MEYGVTSYITVACNGMIVKNIRYIAEEVNSMKLEALSLTEVAKIWNDMVEKILFLN